MEKRCTGKRTCLFPAKLQKLPAWVLQAAERLKQAQIECMPAKDLIRRFDYENVFMYIDPPYVLSTRTGKQYKHEMTG